MTKIKRVIPGDVIRLKAGLSVWHHQRSEVTVLNADTVILVETVRDTATGSEDDHFESCYMVEGRALNVDLTYAPEGAYVTFAQEGDFRPEFIQAECEVLRKMAKKWE